MLRRIAKGSIGAALTVALSMGFTACTDDQQSVEDPINAGLDTAPPPPPEPIEPEITDLAEAADAAENFTPETVYFDFDTSSLTSEARMKLDNLAAYLKNNAAATVQIEGHCDERGSYDYNLALGVRRAQSVKDYLVQSGIEASRFGDVKSFGEYKPVVEGHNEAAWAQNRRAEFTITTL